MNPLRHFYLYAKGYYKRNREIEKDLHRLLTAYLGRSHGDLDVWLYVIYTLSTEVFRNLNRSRFSELLIDLYAPMSRRERELYPDSLDGSIPCELISERIVRGYLSILMNTHLSSTELGTPDPTILPVRKDTE